MLNEEEIKKIIAEVLEEFAQNRLGEIVRVELQQFFAGKVQAFLEDLPKWL